MTHWTCLACQRVILSDCEIRMVTFLHKHPVTSCRLNISSCEIEKAVKWDGSGSSTRAGCGSRFELDEWRK